MRKNNLTLPPDGAVWRALLLTLVLTSCAAHAEFPQDQADAERKATKDAEIKRQAEWKRKYNEAKPIFDKLCVEQSQPIIKRTVEDVEGVLLLKVRPSTGRDFNRLLADQMWSGAALPLERKVDTGYVEAFLLDRNWREWGPPNPGREWRIVAEIGGSGQRGFRFVDLLEQDGTSRVRVTARSDLNAKNTHFTGISVLKTPTTALAPRYAITYEDNVDPELRKHWIAGTTIRVIDTTTNEVIGHQSFWNWDEGFGNTSGGRSPWGAARKQCPLNSSGDKQTHFFVDSVIKAKQ